MPETSEQLNARVKKLRIKALKSRDPKEAAKIEMQIIELEMLLLGLEVTTASE